MTPFRKLEYWMVRPRG